MWTHQAGHGHINSWIRRTVDTSDGGHIGSWTLRAVVTSGQEHIGSWTQQAVVMDTAVCFNFEKASSFNTD